jgi:hypothetical protein
MGFKIEATDYTGNLFQVYCSGDGLAAVFINNKKYGSVPPSWARRLWEAVPLTGDDIHFEDEVPELGHSCTLAAAIATLGVAKRMSNYRISRDGYDWSQDMS